MSVNNANSGDGRESLNVKFDHDLDISFNSRYLIDVASQLDGDKIEIFFNDTGSTEIYTISVNDALQISRFSEFCPCLGATQHS